MSRKFLTAIDLTKNELQNARIQNLATDPSNPVLGQVYFNTVANEMRIYNGTIFEAIGLNGVTADAAELNILDGATLTTTELNYVDGVTSSIQTQLDGKQAIVSGVSDTEIGYLDGVTSGIQGQLDLKAPLANPTFTGTVTLDTGVDIVFEGATANSFETTLTAGDPTADRTVTLPDRTTTLVGTDTTDTLTNKTLTSPNVSGLTITDGSIVVEGSTADNFETTVSFVDPTADQTIYVPNASGTLARLEDKLHNFALATSSLDLNNQKITNLATPTDANDATNKAYVDSAVAGLNWKQAVNLVAITNVALTGLTNTLVIDGHSALEVNDNNVYRILLTNQTNGAEEGIYKYTDDGTNYTLVRSTDADTYQELIGASVFVMEGTAYGNTSWVQGNHYITDFTTQSWTQFSGANAASAGDGLVASGNVFNVGAGTGITVNANDVAIDTGVVVRKYAADLGNGSATSFTITHNLGTRDVTVGIYEPAASYAEVMADVEHSTTNTITVKFTTAPTTDQFRVVVHG